MAIAMITSNSLLRASWLPISLNVDSARSWAASLDACAWASTAEVPLTAVRTSSTLSTSTTSSSLRSPPLAENVSRSSVAARMSSASGARSARRLLTASFNGTAGVVVGCQRNAVERTQGGVDRVGDRLDRAQAVVDPVDRVGQRRRQLRGRRGDRGRGVDAVTDGEDRRTERGERVVDGLHHVLGDDQRRVDGRQRLLRQHEALLVGVGQLAEELPSDDRSHERTDDADVRDDDHDPPGRPLGQAQVPRLVTSIVGHVVGSTLVCVRIFGALVHRNPDANGDLSGTDRSGRDRSGVGGTAHFERRLRRRANTAIEP